MKGGGNPLTGRYMKKNINTSPIEKQLIEFLEQSNVLPTEGYSTTINKKRKSEWGSFQAMSDFSRDPMDKEDIFDLLAQVSKGAFKTFNLLKTGYDKETGLCTIEPPYDSKGSQIVFSRLTKELRDVGLVRKVPVSLKPRPKGMIIFMFNPHYVKAIRYSEALELWNKL